MSKDIDDKITIIRNLKSEDAFLDVTLTLLKIIQNVLGNPDKPKFKKLKRNTKVRLIICNLFIIILNHFLNNVLFMR